MILIPDYAAGGDLIGGWICDKLGMLPGQNMYRDQSWPDNPDRVICLYETGGNWDVDKGLWLGTLQLAIRAARLVEAHAGIRIAIAAALNGFRTCPTANRKGVVTLYLASAPRVSPRDADNRVYVDCTFVIEMDAPYDTGR